MKINPSKGMYIMSDVDDKIKVFISSDCKKTEYRVLRKSIKILLEKTGFIKAYVFENDLATTIDAEDRFIDKLDEVGASRVVLFCVEEKPEACHRSIVTEKLEKLGYKVEHL